MNASVNAKEEALRAVRHLIEALRARDGVGDKLQDRLLIATAEHAKEQIENIQEVLRARKPKKEEGRA